VTIEVRMQLQKWSMLKKTYSLQKQRTDPPANCRNAEIKKGEEKRSFDSRVAMCVKGAEFGRDGEKKKGGYSIFNGAMGRPEHNSSLRVKRCSRASGFSKRKKGKGIFLFIVKNSGEEPH